MVWNYYYFKGFVLKSCNATGVTSVQLKANDVPRPLYEMKASNVPYVTAAVISVDTEVHWTGT